MTSQVSPYSIPDLKNTTDDALPNYLTSLKFVQDHTYTDVRLALGYAAVLIGGALFYADFKLGWDVTKPYTLPAVVVYFALNSAFTYWIWFVERNAVFVGRREGVKIIIETKTPNKHSPTYELTVRSQSSASANSIEQKVTAPFTRWFTSDGFFIAKPFQQWLASSVDVIGKADPANVVEDIGQGSGVVQKPAVKSMDVKLGDLNDVLGYINQASGAEPAASAKKSRKRG